MSGLRAAANRPDHPLQKAELAEALTDAASFEREIEGTPWADVPRTWALAQASLRDADVIYVALAERHQTTLETAGARIERSGAPFTCEILTVALPQ